MLLTAEFSGRRFGHGCWMAGLVRLSVSVLCLGTAVSATAQVESFEVTSVKPNRSTDRRAQPRYQAFTDAGRLVIAGMPVRSLIQRANDLQSFELLGGDDAILNQKVDIEAKTARPGVSALQMQHMLQPILEQRFKLRVHREQRQMDALVLRIDDKDKRFGPRMKESSASCDDFRSDAPPPAGEPPRCGYTPRGVGRIVGVALDMRTIIGLLTALGRPIVDETGLQGRYDIDVTYTPQPFSAAALAQRGGTPMEGVDPNGPSLVTAIQEQLGLKLVSMKLAISVMVIDHIEPLSEN